MHEWPLVIFTLLMQASIGCVVLTLLYKCCGLCSVDKKLAANVLCTPLVGAFVLGALGLVASMFHLGNPLHAFFTLLNASSSWMSREILLTGLFMGLLLLTLYFVVCKKQISSGLLFLTVVVGIIDVYAMSSIYVSTQFTLWSAPFTVAAFYASTLLIGGVLSSMLLAPKMQKMGLTAALKHVMCIAMGAMILGLILSSTASTSIISLFGQPLSTGMVEKVLPQGLLSLALWRGLCLALGMLFFGGMFCKKKTEGCNATPLLLAATLFIVLAEGLGRYIFFSLGA